MENEPASAEVEGGTVYLRVTVGDKARCHFAWSADSEKLVLIGEEFQAKSSGSVGTKVGLFSSALLDSNDQGYADFDWFRVTGHRGKSQ